MSIAVKQTNRTQYPWELPAEGHTLDEAEQALGCPHPLGDSVTYSPPQPPAAPAYVQVQAVSESKAMLQWEQVQGADRYLVLRGDTPDSLQPLAAEDTTTYIDNQIQPGSSYVYTVRSHNAHGQSPAAPLAYFGQTAAQADVQDADFQQAPSAAQEHPMPPPFAGKRMKMQRRASRVPADERDGIILPEPPAPADLRAKTCGTRLVELYWNDTPHEGVQYRLYRSETPWCSYALIAETEKRYYLDTVPQAGETYYYFVQSMREGRFGKPSAMAQALTYPALPEPEPPGRLRAVLVNPETIELRWSHARGAAAYIIFARTEGEEFRAIGHTADGSFLHENLTPELAVEYRVQSYHDTGVSEMSSICSARTSAARARQTHPPARPVPPPQSRRFPSFNINLGDNLLGIRR